MNTYNKDQRQRTMNTDLVIHWFNFGKKTLDFKGTAKEYLQRENIKYSVTTIQHKDLDIETLKIRCKFNCGSLNVDFTTNTFEDMVRMCINIRLSYLGDKAKFTFYGRTRTINY
jgi:hypothetical protein